MEERGGNGAEKGALRILSDLMIKHPFTKGLAVATDGCVYVQPQDPFEAERRKTKNAVWVVYV